MIILLGGRVVYLAGQRSAALYTSLIRLDGTKARHLRDGDRKLCLIANDRRVIRSACSCQHLLSCRRRYRRLRCRALRALSPELCAIVGLSAAAEKDSLVFPLQSESADVQKHRHVSEVGMIVCSQRPPRFIGDWATPWSLQVLGGGGGVGSERWEEGRRAIRETVGRSVN